MAWGGAVATGKNADCVAYLTASLTNYESTHSTPYQRIRCTHCRCWGLHSLLSRAAPAAIFVTQKPEVSCNTTSVQQLKAVAASLVYAAIQQAQTLM